MSDIDFDALMSRLRAGDQEAASVIFEQYARRLIGLARVRLDERLRAKLDAEDVIQSVFRTFFRRQADGLFDLANWDNLWSVLTVITLRKCDRKRRFFHTGSRDIRREDTPLAAEEVTAEGWEALARGPTPVEAGMLTDTMNLLEFYLDDDVSRRILALKLQEYSVPDISRELGIHERKVYRVLEKLKRLLQRLLEDDRET